ncbi:D-alanyl-D-alanine carboxypeptidase [Roseovarius albus]|uniref:D-alanyl-D-alanine carboxypeptidase n=1 Tax=Roseovarius albus TaxID=1247867 RepID=A0A1X6YY96_9RHOB|nr:serine hydrolase [Roseovarius albus]SLN34884.1 D-alanyl-D-alanine carboxypeptidase [Roseovarius albus]
MKICSPFTHAMVSPFVKTSDETEPVIDPSSLSGLSSWIRADTAVSVDGSNIITTVKDVRDTGYSEPVGAPSIAGLAACAIDVSTREVLYWKNPSYATTPASVTKSPVIAHALRIMGGYGVNLTDSITMEAGDFEGPETTPSLAVGDTMSLQDLMYISMLESANAAVRCIARVLGREVLSDPTAPPHVAIEAFIADFTDALMEDGINGFHMESVSGVYDFEGEMLGGAGGSDHVATAHAVAQWARYSHLTSGMDAIWGVGSHSYTITAGPNQGSNTINHLIGMASDVDVYGAKGGALPGLVGKVVHAVADLPDGRKIAVAVLQSHTRESDARAIINYCAGIPAGSGVTPQNILPGNGVQFWKEGSNPAPLLVSDALGAAFDFGSATDSVGPYLRADVPGMRTLFFVWDREVSQIGATVWEAWMDIWGGTVQNVERLTTDKGTNGWWSKAPGVTIYKNAVETDALLPFERCVIAMTITEADSLGIFGSGRNDEYRNLSGKIREILTFERVLSLSEIRQITDYLADEYGVS